jgi:uncharacterized membrane protein
MSGERYVDLERAVEAMLERKERSRPREEVGRQVRQNDTQMSEAPGWRSGASKGSAHFNVQAGSIEETNTMSDPNVPVQVIVAAFHDVDGASNALESLKEAKRDDLIGIQDAAVITKDANGKVKIKETADMRAGKGATIGAVTGGVLGLLAGPVGWAALGGGVVGGLAAKMRDGGFPDDRLRQLAEGLTPNSSALVAVIDHRWVGEVEQELARQQADTVTQALSDDIQKQLAAGGDVMYTVVGDGENVVAARATTTDDLPAALATDAASTSEATVPATPTTDATASATAAPPPGDQATPPPPAQ